MVNKYRSGLSDTDIITELFNADYDIVYSDDFQSKVYEEMEIILAGDIDYLNLFSDRKAQITTLSQKKAGETLRLYIDAVSNNSLSLQKIKIITHHYMNLINSSSEINPSEKSILLRSLPITLTSGFIWTSISNFNPEY